MIVIKVNKWIRVWGGQKWHQVEEYDGIKARTACHRHMVFSAIANCKSAVGTFDKCLHCWNASNQGKK